MVTYPVLVGEIAKRGIKKKTIAKSISFTSKSHIEANTFLAPVTAE